MTGTGLDDFVSIINGKVMYFSAIYPIGEANVLVNEALKYTLKLDFFTTFVCSFIKLNKNSMTNPIIAHIAAMHKLSEKE